jgi:hypothetical protein
MMIATYRVSVYGGPQGRAGLRAQVHLEDEAAERIGVINFFDQPRDVAGDTVEPVITMNLPISMLGTVVDLLRNEKPVLLRGSPTHATLTTLEEVTGEGNE